jgi:MFS superfamily sulfate permease-like transporter
VAVSAATLAILLAWPRLRTPVPGPFVALVATTVMV